MRKALQSLGLIFLFLLPSCDLFTRHASVSPKETPPMKKLDEQLLESHDLHKIATYLAANLMEPGEFKEIDCEIPKEPELVHLCYEYIGSGSENQERINILWTEVMNRLVERARDKFLLPDPPYAQQDNWYTTVWGIPTTRYTFGVVLMKTLKDDLKTDFLQLDIPYWEGSKWDVLHPPR